MIVSNFSERLSKTLQLRNMKASQVVKESEYLYKIGKINKPITKPLMSNYLKGSYEAKQDNLYALSLILNVDEAWLMGLDVPMQKNSNKVKLKTIKIPVVGTVAAGEPILAEQNIIDYEELPAEEFKDGEYFGLKVKGNSMFPRILERDVVIVRQQNDCESGQIAVILINGDEATVKQIKKIEKGIMLIPFNTQEYEPMFFTKEDCKTKPVKIIGVVKRLIGYNFD